MKRKPRGYWTKRNLKKEANKYQNKSDFYKYSKSAYTQSKRKGIFNIICRHMNSDLHKKATFRLKVFLKHAVFLMVENVISL